VALERKSAEPKQQQQQQQQQKRISQKKRQHFVTEASGLRAMEGEIYEW